MYWANQFGHTIWRANLDGTGQETVLTGLSEPAGIALDVAVAKMYWADVQGSILLANLDGTGLETLVTDGFGDIGIALDFESDQMYWTQF